MSAAALKAHENMSEPDSKQSRGSRDRIADPLTNGASRMVEMRRFRSRNKHRLPCEP